MKTYIVKVKDMAFNKKGQRVPEHNEYHNKFKPEDIKLAFKLFIEQKNDDAKDNLLSMLRFCKRDYDADIHNDELNKNDTHAHYKKYIDIIKENINKDEVIDIKNKLDIILQEFENIYKDV